MRPPGTLLLGLRRNGFEMNDLHHDTTETKAQDKANTTIPGQPNCDYERHLISNIPTLIYSRDATEGNPPALREPAHAKV